MIFETDSIEKHIETCLLWGYEKLCDTGFSLPLFKKTTNSNSWYVALTDRTFDMQCKIIGFTQYCPKTPEPLPLELRKHVSVGNSQILVFLWKGQIRIGSIEEIGRWHRKNLLKVSDIIPITSFDISLYSRQRKLHLVANRSLAKLSERVGSKYARYWSTHVAQKQAGQLDVWNMCRNSFKSLSERQSLKLNASIIDCFTYPLGEQTTYFVFNDELTSIIDDSFSAKQPLAFSNCLSLAFDNELKFISFREFEKNKSRLPSPLHLDDGISKTTKETAPPVMKMISLDNIYMKFDHVFIDEQLENFIHKRLIDITHQINTSGEAPINSPIAIIEISKINSTYEAHLYIKTKRKDHRFRSKSDNKRNAFNNVVSKLQKELNIQP